MELHGGRISVHSPVEGLGCSITVDLPVYIQTESPLRQSHVYHRRRFHFVRSSISLEDLDSQVVARPARNSGSVLSISPSLRMLSYSRSGSSGSSRHNSRVYCASCEDLRGAVAAARVSPLDHVSPSRDVSDEVLPSAPSKQYLSPAHSPISQSGANLMVCSTASLVSVSRHFTETSLEKAVV